MKKFLIIGFLFLSVLSVAQTKTYHFNFVNKTQQEILQTLEIETGVNIRYAPTWLNDTPQTVSFENKSLVEILHSLLSETTLNAFELNQRTIILTNNNLLFDAVAESFFKVDKSEPENELTPLIPKFNQINDTSTQLEKAIKIGRQDQVKNRYWYTLSGSIVDKETKEPISGVSIAVPAIEKYYSNDFDGTYDIKLPKGLSELTITVAGYRQLVQPFIIFNDGQFTMELEEMVQALDEVVVKGNKINQVNSSSSGSENISVEETKTVPLVLGERDVLKIAASLPGISSAGEGASGLNVRGGRPDQNLNVLDGGVIYNPTHFFGIFQALNPIAISDLTVYKGTVPAPYGGRLSSVFEITSKEADTQKTKGEIALGPITLNAVIETPIKKEKSSLLMGVRGAYSDWILKKLDNEQLRNNKANFYDVISKFHTSPTDKMTFNLTSYFSKDQFNITHDSLFSYSNTMISANLNKKLSTNKVLNFNSSLTSYQHQIDYEGNAQNGFIQSYTLNQINSTLSLLNFNKNNHQISWGTTNTYYWIQPGIVTPKYDSDLTLSRSLNKEHALEGAIFFSDQWDVNSKLQLTSILRLPYYLSLGPDTVYAYDPSAPKSTATVMTSQEIKTNQIESSFIGPELRFSSRYLLGEQASIKFGINNAYQFLHSLSNSTTAAPYDTWKLSDRHLAPQKVEQATLGYAYKSTNNGFDFTADLYYKRYQNLTDFKTGAQLKMNDQIETEIIQGTGKSYGVELLLRKNDGDLSGWISYSYARTFIQLNSEFLYERVNGGKFFPSNYDKPHDLSIVANYKFSRRFSFSGNLSYQSGRPVTYPTSKYELDGITYITYSERNKYRIPDYFRIDLGFNVEGNHKINKPAHGFWSISIYNILGKNNPYSVFFVNEDGKIKAYQSSIFAHSIPSLSYTLKF